MTNTNTIAAILTALALGACSATQEPAESVPPAPIAIPSAVVENATQVNLPPLPAPLVVPADEAYPIVHYDSTPTSAPGQYTLAEVVEIGNGVRAPQAAISYVYLPGTLVTGGQLRTDVIGVYYQGTIAVFEGALVAAAAAGLPHAQDVLDAIALYGDGPPEDCEADVCQLMASLAASVDLDGLLQLPADHAVIFGSQCLDVL